MKKLYAYTCLIWLFSTALALGQPKYSYVGPFSVTYNFDNQTRSGVSNVQGLQVGDLTLFQVNTSPTPYVTNGAGKAISIENWDPNCGTTGDYASITIQPIKSGDKFTITQIQFQFQRTSLGPTVLGVRCSADGYTSLVGGAAYGPTTTYQQATLNVNYVDVTGPITFRFVGCSNPDNNGALRLDNIVLSGQASLPVNLVSFTAKPQGNRVQLSWETAQERNADYFEVQRSADLSEFRGIGQVTAKGITDSRQYYGLLDERPLDGANYYRLKQVDTDGQVAYSKVVSAVLDEQTPSLAVLGNPVEGQSIRVAVRNLADARYSLTTLMGKVLAVSTEPQSDGSLLLVPTQPLTAGVYILKAQTAIRHLTQKVVVP